MLNGSRNTIRTPERRSLIAKDINYTSPSQNSSARWDTDGIRGKDPGGTLEGVTLFYLKHTSITDAVESYSQKKESLIQHILWIDGASDRPLDYT